MKKIYFSVAVVLGLSAMATAQTSFPVEIDVTGFSANDWVPTEVVVPTSPLKTQVLFVGSVDEVQTLDANGNPNGSAPAKQWHDFIGFTEDSTGADYGWISVNHEMVIADDKIGDGGGMTVFKVTRDASNDTLIIVEQTLNDGREGKFFNVDFVNTVGETGMNCGGINSPNDGRIWTAEEWFRSNTASIYDGGNGVRDTADWTIDTDISGDFDGSTIRKYENFNWMVEIDPTQATAIRKQYNWGRMGFEGGTILPDNKTVFLGIDATPAGWFKFVADVAGDFTSGSLYAYKQDGTNHWIEINNTQLSNMLDVESIAFAQGATMFNRVEWVTLSENGKVYFTETGRDNPGGRWADEHAAGGTHAEHHTMRALQQNTHPDSADYADYYGRVMEFDPATDEMRVFVAGGPEYGASDVPLSQYPEKHLSNPDGLSILRVEGREFLMICEDLNGRSYGRMPAGISNSTCEMFLLDMSIHNPTVNDLMRVAMVPEGAEITGACSTPDGKTVLFNSQHPSTNNPYPYNNSLTVAITGWDEAVLAGDLDPLSIDEVDAQAAFTMYPNPATREVRFNKNVDVALYDITGKRMRVIRNSNYMDISDLDAGTYFVRTEEGDVQTLIIQ
ncbi:MAG: phosphatase [Crocinitomicaceae bacterium]|nr:phosphatase [Crocinitomicaceae bacterium]|tara:strand:+ start:20958 stop:22808 length:1851 start_codon:yes stop_codon:yes gene_type:complete